MTAVYPLQMHSCPLCASPTSPHHQTTKRAFFRCATCHLVHVPAVFHVDVAGERAVYDLHENHPDDPGYRRFLSRAVNPLLARLPSRSIGLDFGCGPGPTVSSMLRSAGHTCADYDPLYRNEPALLEATYDFVISTEVVEHLRTPAPTLQVIFDLAPIVVLMTKRTTTASAFKGWHYHHDPTHITFYADATMRWLADRYGRHVDLPSPDVAVFHR
jgi:hypothetical protein